jgi:hypothetical protein
MAIFANVTAISYVSGSPTIDIVVAILKGIDDAARIGGADFGIRVTLTYVDGANNVDTLDSGILSIQNNTVLLSQLDSRTVLIKMTLSFGSLPLPGNSPSYSTTAQVFHQDGSGNNVELGPAE